MTFKGPAFSNSTNTMPLLPVLQGPSAPAAHSTLSHFVSHCRVALRFPYLFREPFHSFSRAQSVAWVSLCPLATQRFCVWLFVCLSLDWQLQDGRDGICVTLYFVSRWKGLGRYLMSEWMNGDYLFFSALFTQYIDLSFLLPTTRLAEFFQTHRCNGVSPAQPCYRISLQKHSALKDRDPLFTVGALSDFLLNYW